MNITLLMGIVFAGALTAALLIVFALSGSVAGAQSKRLDRVRNRANSAVRLAESDGAESLVKQEDDGFKTIERMFSRLLPKKKMLEQRLMRAGLKTSVGKYMAITIVVIVLLFAVLHLIFAFGAGLSLPIAIGLGTYFPHRYLTRLINRREQRFTQLFPEAIDLMVRGLKSGLPITETIVNVGQDMDDPVGVEFREVTDSVKLGESLEEALWGAVERLDTPEFKFFVISLSVQRETGGNLGETLANLSDILRKRLQMRLKVKAMSSEAKASAYIIGSLPFLMFAIMAVINPDYAFKLFTDPRGVMMTAVGLGMMLTGAGVMYKMVKFDI